MKNVISLASKEKPEADVLIGMLQRMIIDIEAGNVRAVSFALLKNDTSLVVGAEVVLETSTLTMLGAIRALEQWYMDEHLRDILSEA